MDSVCESALDGVGLFRTEFLALTGAGIPSEEKQDEAYRAVIDGPSRETVRIRTFDIGAEGGSVAVAGDGHRLLHG